MTLSTCSLRAISGSDFLPPYVLHHRSARNHAQGADLCEFCNHGFRHAICEVILRCITGEICHIFAIALTALYALLDAANACR